MAERAQKLRREQKREGEEVKEEKKKKREKIGESIKLQYLNLTHHGVVEFHVPFYIT